MYMANLQAGLEMAMGIHVLAMDAGLDGLEPLILQNALDRDPSLRVGVQDLLHQFPGAHGQLLEGLVAVRGVGAQEVLVVGILSSGGTEWDSLVDHTIVHNSTSPDVDPAGIVFLAHELFRSNVGFGSAEALGEMRVLLPAHPEDVRDAEIRDLEMTVAVEEEVFGFDVSVGDTHRVQVGDAVNQLLEAAVDFDSRHVSLLDCVVKIATTAVLLFER